MPETTDSPSVPQPFHEAFEGPSLLASFNQWVQESKQDELISALPAFRRAAAIALSLNSGYLTRRSIFGAPERVASLRERIEKESGLSLEEFEEIRSRHNFLERYWEKRETEPFYPPYVGYEFISAYINDLVRYVSLGRERFTKEEAPDLDQREAYAEFSHRLTVLDMAAKALENDSSHLGNEAIKILISEGVRTKMGPLVYQKETDINKAATKFKGMMTAGSDFMEIYLELAKHHKEKILAEPSVVE